MGVEELETVLGYSLGKGRQQGEEKEKIWGGGSSWMEAYLLQWKKKTGLSLQIKDMRHN